jgi:hypothetical protein
MGIEQPAGAPVQERYASAAGFRGQLALWAVRVPRGTPATEPASFDTEEIALDAVDIAARPPALRFVTCSAILVGAMTTGSGTARAHVAALGSTAADDDETAAEWTHPRKRQLPRQHRFRLGLQLSYVRLSAAVDEGTGESQRFHLVPLGIDAGYQLQFAKRFMLRPSFGIAPNVGNSMEAMPFIVHPKLFVGYQGALFGAAFGYGWFTAPVARKDVNSAARRGPNLPQPTLTNNHHVGVELSLTSRLAGERGELSVALYVGGVSGRLAHLQDLDARGWRPFIMLNTGWFFGETKAGRERRRQRKRRREQR